MTSNNTFPSRSQEFWAGFKATFPLVVGAIPFGFIYGAVAVSAGISPQGAMAMSLFVFAGSSQFIASGLVAAGTGTTIIILTTFIVNLRHALYSATLAPHMKNLPQRWLIPLGFWLTDESFVVAVQRYHQKDTSPHKHWFFFGSAVFMYTNWQLCTYIGLAAGQAIEDPLKWGLDFAMVVTFIGMLVPLVTNRPAAASAAVAGITAVIANPLPNKIGLILAAVLGITAGVWAEHRLPKDISNDEL
ncbi:MAG: AzlC family ABC transporter permease [Anaerolineae bacterium]|nr:AzlC family ABC transporter permease [Anaerolineae bacterium]